MSRVVVDTSVCIAYIDNELGGNSLSGRMRGALISAVNFAELISVLLRRGKPADLARQVIRLSEMSVVDLDIELAEAIGKLIADTRDQGISLGDCACLALAQREKLPVLTAHRAWRDLDVGVEIQFIR